jgi:putative membrane protein
MKTDENHNSPADPRVYLAVERTFLAWIRTGVALMGFGFVVARFGFFLHELALERPEANDSHLRLSLPFGIALIAIGVMVTLVSAVRHRRCIRALDRGEFRSSYGMGFAYLIAGLLAIIGLSVAISLALVF